MRHLSCPANAEVQAFYITAFFDNLKTEETKPIMTKYGLVGLKPDQWFPCRLYMDSLNEVMKNPNVSENMVAIGMKIGAMIPVPPDLKDPTLYKMLLAWEDAYQFVHRGGEVGHIRTEEIDPKHCKVTLTDLYPDDLSYGVIYAYAQRFLPPGTRFKVFYDPEVTPRDHDGKLDKTVVHVQWP